MTNIETIRLLLVEDDSVDCRQIVRQLRDERCEFIVQHAETLHSAVDKLQSERFDVIISDLHLPDSAGLETVSELRRACARTPIIVLTALEDERVERDIMAVKAQDYLVKGEFGGRAIARAVLHVVQRQQAMDEITELILEQEQSKQQLAEQAELLQRKNERLQQVNKTAQEFVDHVSHDFRTPLTVIKDYATIIREGMVGDINDDQRLMLDKVSIRVDDLNIMVDDLLDVSKLESGLLGAWRRVCRVEDVVDRAVSMLSQRACVKNVALEVDLEPDLPEVYCDCDKVGRVITNLAVNAIKFAGDGGKVKLWAKADESERQVVVGVTDDGPGIDESALEQIFQRFEQLDGMPTSSKGFGLGLSIAQQLCRLNLGELNVESQLGLGSTFSFGLPMNRPAEILRRWLASKSKTTDALHAVEVAIDSDDAQPTCDEFDQFLNCLLRRNDLLFRIAADRWLIVISAPEQEQQLWFARAEKEFDRTNRNRPLGTLPEYQATRRCRWNSQDSHESIVQDFQSIFEEAELEVPIT